MLALSHDAFDEHDHLVPLNQAISVLVHSVESVIELGLVEVVGRGNVLEDCLQELFTLSFVQSAAIVFVELSPDAVYSLFVDTVAFNLSGQSVAEGLVCCEE